ncbi:MAG: helix-turn-helix transcriptional regulator, partial [Ktedonobacteraceae bacterium]
MATPVKGTPNQKLRTYRKKLGWSQQMVADYLLKLSEEAGKNSGITGELVGRWERGTHAPSPFYREKLCRLFNVSADMLGFFDELTELPVQAANGGQPLAAHVDGHDGNAGLAALLEKEAEPVDPELVAAHTWLHEEPAPAAGRGDSDAERLVAAVMREVIEWQQGSLLVLQSSVYKQIRSYDDMAEHETQQAGQMSRREALRVIAKLPIQVYGLAALGTGALTAVAEQEFLPM